jgi:protein HIRA/HIR1
VKRIGAEGLKGKIEELLRDLSGDLIAEDEDTETTADTLCGWKKEDLLKEAVLILGKFLPGSLLYIQLTHQQANIATFNA